MTAPTAPLILGLNAFHGDSSACILRGRELVAAAEEERFRRVKHWAGFPSEAIRYCLAEAGARIEDVTDIALNQDTRANRWRRLGHVLRHPPDPQIVLDRLRRRRRRADLASHFEAAFGAGRVRARIHKVEHHLCHLASTFYGSGYPDAVAVSVDGFGDFASAAWGFGKGAALSVDERVFFPHSLGVFYQALTQYLGFPHYGDEYKVMGLAPYGRPSRRDDVRKLVDLDREGRFRLNLEYFRHANERIEFTWRDGAPVFGPLYSEALCGLLGPARDPDAPLADAHRDIASSAQAVYEEAFFNLLRAVHRRYASDRLVLAGGCAMNSVANGKVYASTPFRQLYVQAAPGDAGGALGAAQVAWTRIDAAERGSPPAPMTSAYWGPAFDDAAIADEIRRRDGELESARCTIERFDDEAALCDVVARRIAAGDVVGWFQGRMEWGPRALGNRSILCDPRRSDMKALLNAKIKRRESFRPFAPSILRQRVPEWFETDDDVPFMTQVYSIRPERRSAVPAVTHVDGSGRLQTVTHEGNPRYYRLIESFERLTGVPMVLNTSFNESEPIVCTPAEAMDCFLRTNMDCLVLGDRVVRRNGA